MRSLTKIPINWYNRVNGTEIGDRARGYINDLLRLWRQTYHEQKSESQHTKNELPLGLRARIPWLNIVH